MNLLVLGATGRTGREVLDIALARGHAVTAFVRSPHKVPKLTNGSAGARPSVRQGDVLDVGALAAALDGHEAVLSTLGLPTWQALRPSTFMTESAASTVAAMTRAGTRRLAILSAAVLFPGAGLQFTFFSWLLRHHARDLREMETVVGASDLAWTVARPPRLVRASDEAYRSRRDALPGTSLSVSYRAVAAFLVDSIERGLHFHEVVGVSR
jgi:putative NADH-flavin reductase